jgi:hypothetical protein
MTTQKRPTEEQTDGFMEKQLQISYVEATAISSMAEALEMILLAYTQGYNTMPRDREKRRLLEEGCSAVSAYRTVMGKEVMQRIHREQCGHTTSTTDPQALAAYLLDRLAERTGGPNGERLGAAALGIASAAVLAELREDPAKWADLVIRTSKQALGVMTDGPDEAGR